MIFVDDKYEELRLITAEDVENDIVLSNDILEEFNDGRGSEEEEERVESLMTVLSAGETRRKSKLVSKEILSPNNSTRTGRIRRSTPHHTAGKLTAEAIAKLFVPTSRKASPSYCIGFDGDSVLSVPEDRRPWTSSSSINDNLAITFEISNSAGGPDWPISDESLNTWVDIQIDICEFYGYKGVKYVEKPANIVGANAVENWIKTWEDPNYLTITLHQWFAATACPGPYFMRKLPLLVKEINEIMDSVVEPEKPKDPITPTEPEKPNAPFEEYLIRITATALNVRTGPGTNYPVAQTLRSDVNLYTIVEESDGPGVKSKWGKLKSGAGWISLDYTVKA